MKTYIRTIFAALFLLVQFAAVHASTEASLAGIKCTKDRYQNYWIREDIKPEQLHKIVEAIKPEVKLAGIFVVIPHTRGFLAQSLRDNGFVPYRLDTENQIWLYRNEREIPEQSNALGDSRVIIINEQNEVLLVQNRLTKFWYVPGGGINRDELAIDAAVREAQEEVGISLYKEKLVLIATVNQSFPVAEQPTNIYGHFFVTRLKGKVDLKIDPAEIEKAKWIPIDELVSGNTPDGVELHQRLIQFKDQFVPEQSAKKSTRVAKQGGTPIDIQTFKWSWAEAE